MNLCENKVPITFWLTSLHKIAQHRTLIRSIYLLPLSTCINIVWSYSCALAWLNSFIILGIFHSLAFTRHEKNNDCKLFHITLSMTLFIIQSFSWSSGLKRKMEISFLNVYRRSNDAPYQISFEIYKKKTKGGDLYNI